MTSLYNEGDVIAVPMTYEAEFRRSPAESLLQYGSLPQRAGCRASPTWPTSRTRWCCPTSSAGAAPAGERHRARPAAGANPDRRARLTNAHQRPGRRVPLPRRELLLARPLDLALNTKRHGDARRNRYGPHRRSWIEREVDPAQQRYSADGPHLRGPLRRADLSPGRRARSTSARSMRFILQLKQLRGFNITSFSVDGFQSRRHPAAADARRAGDGRDEHRLGHRARSPACPSPSRSTRSTAALPRAARGLHRAPRRAAALPILRRELREMEVVEPGQAPDHPARRAAPRTSPTGRRRRRLSGRLRARRAGPRGRRRRPRDTLEREHGLAPARQLGVEDDEASSLASASPAARRGIGNPGRLFFRNPETTCARIRLPSCMGTSTPRGGGRDLDLRKPAEAAARSAAVRAGEGRSRHVRRRGRSRRSSCRWIRCRWRGRC